MASPLLEVDHLRVEFSTRRGTLLALDDVSFTIAPGEILGVVGESGAGKSLPGAAILGLLEPPGRVAGGQVLLQGQRIDNLPAEAMRKIRGKRIGAIFQDPLTSLNPLFTVGQQLVDQVQSLRTRDRHSRHVVAQLLQPLLQVECDDGFVFHHQDAGRRFHGAWLMGNRRVKRVGPARCTSSWPCS